MFFKLDYVLKPIHIGERDMLMVELQTQLGRINIFIAKREGADPRSGAAKGDLDCEAILERHVPVQAEVLFNAMDKKVLPGIQVIIDGSRAELGRCIDGVIENLKWTQGIIWMHDRVRYASGLKWSLDGNGWKQVPNEIRLTMGLGLAEPIHLKQHEIDRVKIHVEGHIGEPLGHTLLSEAYAQRTNHPRSSLVMGIAAAEVGWKQFVAALLPDTKWLVENTASPPLEKMVKELLPLIPIRSQITGKKAEIPDKLMGLLKKGVLLRNKTVHAGYPALDRMALEEILLSVRDLLYLLDLYKGHSWAAERISSKTLQELSKLPEL